MTEKVELTVDLVNGILGYLEQKPFKESAPFINRIAQEVNDKPKVQTEELVKKELLTE